MDKKRLARIRIRVNNSLIGSEFYGKLLSLLYAMTGGNLEGLSISKHSNNFEIDASEVASIVPLLDAIIVAITSGGGTPPPVGR